MRRGGLFALLAVAWAASVQVAAAAVLWTIVMVPLTTQQFASTTYTITVTDLSLPNDLGCVDVNVPATFVIQGVGDPVATGGRDWTWYQIGNTVVFHAVDGGDRLHTGESVTMTITAQATQAGVWTWTNHGHRQQDCSGVELPGTPLAVTVLPVVIASSPPTPVPTPVPTPIPTLPPLPTPLPTLPPLPTPLPTLQPLPTPLPTLPPLPGLTPSPDPTVGASPAPTSGPPATPEPNTAAIDGGPGAPGGSGGTGGAGDTGGTSDPVGRIAELDESGVGSIGLSADVFGLLDGELVWFVPGAAVGVPGLLVLLWIALQTAGALAWVPAVRRMGSVPAAARRRRRRPARV